MYLSAVKSRLYNNVVMEPNLGHVMQLSKRERGRRPHMLHNKIMLWGHIDEGFDSIQQPQPCRQYIAGQLVYDDFCTPVAPILCAMLIVKL